MGFVSFLFSTPSGKVEGSSKSEQNRLQTPERKNADIKEKQASFVDYLNGFCGNNRKSDDGLNCNCLYREI